jgi:hypothetical protein
LKSKTAKASVQAMKQDFQSPMEEKMTTVKSDHRLENKWVTAHAKNMSEPENLLYRSNLLGSDKRITNYGGGNTSAKIIQSDPLTGAATKVL